jgi:hypothetical protein
MKVVRLSVLCTFTPQEIFLVIIFGRGWVNPRATVWPVGLSQWKIPWTPVGNRTCHLLACSTAPQPNAPLCAPFLYCDHIKTSVHKTKLRIFKIFYPLDSSTMELEITSKSKILLWNYRYLSKVWKPSAWKCTKLQLKLSSCSFWTL